MDTIDPLDRLTLLERMADQQLRLNTQLIEVTARLGEEQGHHAEALFRADVAVTRLDQDQALHAERLERYDAILTRLDAESARHAQRLERLDTILQAIKDLLDRGNGH